jgi:hypothetical protein
MSEPWRLLVTQKTGKSREVEKNSRVVHNGATLKKGTNIVQVAKLVDALP